MAIDPLSTASASQPGSNLDPSAIRQSLEIDDKQKRAEAVADQLEGVFMEMMVKAMRDTVPEDGLFGQSLGGKNYIEMLDQQYAQLQGGMRDPRFHEALVRQIMQTPEDGGQALDRIKKSDSAAKSAAWQPKLN